MSASPSAAPLPRETGYALLATATLSLLPFLSGLPVLMAALTALLLAWQFWRVRQQAPRPPAPLMLLLAILGAALCYLELRSLFGREAGLAMLTLLLPLKLVEGRDRRDAHAVLLLCCFMMTGQFLNAQSLPVAATVGVCALAILATSARLERPDLSLRAALRTASRLLATALPLMLLLFVLFPRIDGPLWRMPGDAFAASTGLGDTMQPGSISQLILSGEIAFRAEFAGAPPPPRERYWRGPVLSDFDGRVWQERPAFTDATPNYRPSGNAYAYTLTVEAHDRPWLLALDFPIATQEDVRYGRDFTLRSPRPVRTRVRVALVSYPDTRVGLTENPGRLAHALWLPEGSNPRTVAAGQQLAARGATPDERLQGAIDFMRDARLTYTLNPPLLGTHGADEFLFDTRQGFCEHFASAFVVLARATGLPARVVTGYQGGELNPLDGTLVVRQSDAHAWAEVWLAGRGWVRVDPTATSAPARIDGGIAQALPATDALPFLLRSDSPVLRELRHRWEALSNGWNQWVLGYNASRQAELLKQLGLPGTGWREMILALGAGAALWLAWLMWRLAPRGRRRDALDRLWLRACRKLARRNLARQPWETPAAYAARVALRLPGQAAAFREIAETYASLRYGPAPDMAGQLPRLRDLIQRFRP
ncbi:MAG: DUF3488 and transglutaminase-like domain-containing protein [Candidatus Dactylopiibacterium sp.]|nr:DUF3488 and transglutaminase-like domain-containing protein [Candidatus Dactylopiibacterium sp.]